MTNWLIVAQHHGEWPADRGARRGARCQDGKVAFAQGQRGDTAPGLPQVLALHVQLLIFLARNKNSTKNWINFHLSQMGSVISRGGRRACAAVEQQQGAACDVVVDAFAACVAGSTCGGNAVVGNCYVIITSCLQGASRDDSPGGRARVCRRRQEVESLGRRCGSVRAGAGMSICCGCCC